MTLDVSLAAVVSRVRRAFTDPAITRQLHNTQTELERVTTHLALLQAVVDELYLGEGIATQRGRDA